MEYRWTTFASISVGSQALDSQKVEKKEKKKEKHEK